MKCEARVPGGNHPFSVFPDDIPQTVADLVHNTQLNLGVRVNRLRGLRQSPESIYAGDEVNLHPAVLQFVEHAKPELGAKTKELERRKTSNLNDDTENGPRR